MARGLAPVVAGVAVGALIAFAAGRLMNTLLFETSGRDPLVLGAVSGLLLVCAVVASFIPGVRATKTDPMTALRAD
jgi:ABC-type antimicrobial peptide transport system permease subunit